jgi:hypothetical protein
MELGHWQFDKEFNPEEWFGFIYKIYELDTGREYIGKKQFSSVRKKVVAGRKNKKTVKSDSKWRAYTSSSKELNEQLVLKGVDNYKFEIISLHKTKGSLYYAEVYNHIVEDVLRCRLPNGERKFMNKWIGAVKFIPPVETEEEAVMKKLKYE